MEFGIEQGIEMAKKKIESPDVQNMIDLSLGLTEGQLIKKGKVGKSGVFQDPSKDKETFDKVLNFTVSGDIGDFLNLTWDEIKQYFASIPGSTAFVRNLRLLDEEATRTIQPNAKATLRLHHTRLKAIYLERWGAKPSEDAPIPDAPTSSDADFQIWLAQLTQLLSPYLQVKGTNPINYHKQWNRQAAPPLGGAMHPIQKNHIADLKKKVQNFITISKNKRDPRIDNYLRSFTLP